MPVSEKTYQRLALEDPEGHWELHDGCLLRKPGMTIEHNDEGLDLFLQLHEQLANYPYSVRHNVGHVRVPGASYYIPDVYVVPREAQTALRGTRRLETYEVPLPLVIEIWSPSTGDYDVEVKLREYQRRGDLEIWRVHPYDRTVTAWRREPDGSYTERVFTAGRVALAFLPNVSIDVDRLFAA